MTLDPSKVLIKIHEYKTSLNLALQSGEDYALLHTNILKFLKIVCSTKSEYKDVSIYPIGELVIVEADGKGNEVEVGRKLLYSENESKRIRSELGERLKNLLAELEAEYKLRKDLEAARETNLKTELKDLKREISLLKDKISSLSL